MNIGNKLLEAIRANINWFRTRTDRLYFHSTAQALFRFTFDLTILLFNLHLKFTSKEN